MPFGGYSDFDDCKKKNKDKDNVDAYCGEIMHRVEDEKGNPTGIYKWVEKPTLQKLYKDSNKKYHFAFYGSSTARDRDGDRFHLDVLKGWENQINTHKMNLGSDHGHGWKDSLGVLKHAEIRHNPNGGIDYLFVDAILEDPEINKDNALLIHKWELGEQISVSIAANPGETKWYDIETDKEGRNTRVIKSAELLKIDVVGEPANPDARAIDIVLKHMKETNCGDDCIVCQFDKCVEKSQGISSLVNENSNKNRMTALSKEDQDKLNKEHGCKEGERYCADEGKCMPAEKEEMKSKLNPDVEKFIEAVKAIATTPAPEAGGDPNGSPPKGDLASIVQQALASMRTNPQMGQLQFNIPSAVEMATPGVSGTSGAQPQTTGTPAATLQPPIPAIVVQASPGNSGAGPAPAGAQGVPATVILSNPAPMPPAQVTAATEPVIEKVKEKKLPRSVMLNEDRLMEYVEKARKVVTPKHENPGEILPLTIDTSKLTGDIKKHAEAYNAEIIKTQAAQVKTIYTPTDLMEKSQKGELLAEMDENKTFSKVIQKVANKGTTNRVVHTLLLKHQ